MIEGFACGNKSRFASEGDANISIKRLRKSHDGLIYRAYLCECGLWHISTKPAISDSELRRENKKLKDKCEQLKKVNKELRDERSKLQQEISRLITEKINNDK